MLFIVGGLLLIVIIGRGCGFIGGRTLPVVTTENAARRTIVETVTASGKIYPETEVKISADISGEIIELYIAEGDSVKKGQLLAKINPDVYQSEVRSAEAAVDNAKAGLASAKAAVLQAEAQAENAQKSFERSKKLFKDKVISDADYETAETADKNAKAALQIAKENEQAQFYLLKSTEANLQQMLDNLKKTTLSAPMTGIVSSLNVKKGERVVGTMQMAGTEMMRIADLSNMEVQVDVSENDILRIQSGDTADVEVDAYLDRKFKGIVTQIANSAGGQAAMLSVEQATNFKVKIKLLESSYTDLLPEIKRGKFPFYPGMSATVEIKTDAIRQVITVPIQAVTTREDTLNENTSETEVREVVFLYKEGKVNAAHVETGIQDDRYIQIVSGVAENDAVVSAPYNAISRTLRNDMEVKTEADKKNSETETKKSEEEKK